MNTWVWVDAWQQQCCGHDFDVGSPVRWSVKRLDPDDDQWMADLLGQSWGGRLEYAQEHHDESGGLWLTGVVRKIQVVTCSLTKEPDVGAGHGPGWIPVRGSGRLREVPVADKWEPEAWVDEPSATFSGWLVQLEQG